MAKKQSINKQMAERIILAKLYKDKVIIVDTANKKVTIDARKGELVKRYNEESYDDIMSILERTSTGLGMQGYDVKVIRLEILVEKAIDDIDFSDTDGFKDQKN